MERRERAVEDARGADSCTSKAMLAEGFLEQGPAALVITSGTPTSRPFTSSSSSTALVTRPLASRAGLPRVK